MLPSELEAQRKVLHLSQAEMADRLGVSRHTYMRWESGKTAKLPVDLAARAGAALGGKAAEISDRGEDLLEVTRHTNPKWYERVSSRGIYRANDSHPGDARIKRKYLDAYKRGDMTMWQEYLDSRGAAEEAARKAAWLAKDEADNEAYMAKYLASIPTLEEALGHYETTGEDDLATERRIQNFFQNQS